MLSCYEEKHVRDVESVSCQAILFSNHTIPVIHPLRGGPPVKTKH